MQTRAASRRFAANVKVNGWQLTGRGQEARLKKSVQRPAAQLQMKKKKDSIFYVDVRSIFKCVTRQNGPRMFCR